MKKRLLILAGVTVAAVVGAYLLTEDQRATQAELKQELAEAELEMKAQQAARSEMLSEEAVMRSNSGREAAARRLGYRKPDEVPLEEVDR